MATQHQLTRSTSPTPRTAQPSRDAAESQSESDLNDSLLSLTIKDENHEKQEGTRRPKFSPRETPFRPSMVVSSSASSTSSSSTTFSIFDTDSKRPETPITPPLPETPISAGSKVLKVETQDSPRRVFFKKKYPKKVGQSSITSHSWATPASPTSPRRPSTPEIPIEDVECTSSTNQDELSPVAQKSYRRKRDEKNPEKRDDIIDGDPAVPITSGESGVNATIPLSKDREVCDLTDEFPSWHLVVDSVSGHAIDYDGTVVNNVKRDNCKRISATILPQSETIVGGDPMGSAEGLSTLDGGRSRLQATHKRSNLAPKLQDTEVHVKDADADSSNSQANEGSSSNSVPIPEPTPKPRRAPRRTSNLSSTPRKSRARSTGSIPGAQMPCPPIRKSTRLGYKRNLAIPTKPVYASSIKTGLDSIAGPKKKASLETDSEPQATPNLAKDPYHQEAPSSEANSEKPLPKFKEYTKVQSEIDVKQGVLKVLKNTKKKQASLRISEIWNMIWNQGGKSKAVSNTEDGFIYIFKCVSFPEGYVKIGSTRKQPEDRRAEWDKQCKITSIRIEDPNGRSFRHYRVVEALVHAELVNKRRTYICWCGVGHQEWFEIEEQEALDMVEKWRKWVIQMHPFTKDGSLRACWMWKVCRAENAKGTDLMTLQEFGWCETLQCCFHCIDIWLGKLWPAGGVLILSLELLAFGLAVLLPLRIFGACISSSITSLAILILYIILWFRYS